MSNKESSKDSILEIRDLQRAFGAQQVLRGVNLDIPRGKITVIIGGSGCGKSVMLKHIIGLVKPDFGNIYLDGKDMVEMSYEELKNSRMRFGMLFQDAALFDSMTVYENVAFPLREHRKKMKENEIEVLVREKLKQVNLESAIHKMPSELSGGMRKRVGLARAIIMNPEIILYDEPTTGLDPVMSRSIDDLIVETQRRMNITSIVISHDIIATLRIADKIAMLHQGQIVAEGTPKEIRHSDNPIVKDFIAPIMNVV